MDTLAFCDAFTRLLDTVLAQLMTELDGYIKRFRPRSAPSTRRA